MPDFSFYNGFSNEQLIEAATRRVDAVPGETEFTRGLARAVSAALYELNRRRALFENANI